MILGGARSGKSEFALSLADKSKAGKVFIATAEALDEEMSERIQKHQDDRDKGKGGWTTVEEPTDVVGVISMNREASVLLLDCVTLWLANLMEKDLTDADILKEVSWLSAAIKEAKGSVIIVSNEVGHSLVSENPLGRRFVDLSGRANQIIAGAVDEVYFITAGLGTKIK
jgi:adenosylcobinamide kinase/adenosylcobinamide-phosphate guanylyltransferase